MTRRSGPCTSEGVWAELGISTVCRDRLSGVADGLGTKFTTLPLNELRGVQAQVAFDE